MYTNTNIEEKKLEVLKIILVLSLILIFFIVQDTERRIYTRYRIQNTITRYRIQDTGYRIQETKYRMQDTGYREIVCLNVFFSNAHDDILLVKKPKQTLLYP